MVMVREQGASPSVILPPATHEPHRQASARPPPEEIRFSLHPDQIAGLKSKRNMPTNTLNCEPLSKFAER